MINYSKDKKVIQQDNDFDPRPWSDIPEEILDQFLNHLAFADHARFSLVCKPWHAATVGSRHHKTLRSPFLFQHRRDAKTLGAYNPIEKKVRRCKILSFVLLGSSMGYLVITTGQPWQPKRYHLLNPLSGRTIQLPYKLSPDSEILIMKAILTSPATRDNILSECCVIVAAGYHYTMSLLAFCRPGDEFWSPIPLPLIESGYHVSDLTFHEGVLYVSMCHSNSDDLMVMVIKFEPQPWVEQLCHTQSPRIAADPIERLRQRFMVASAGKLLMAVILTSHDSHEREPGRFEVFELDPNQSQWVKLANLGNCTWFLDSNNHSSAVVEDCCGYRGNCIYYARGSPFTFYCYVLSLEDGRIRRLPRGRRPASARCPCFWFMLHHDA